MDKKWCDSCKNHRLWETYRRNFHYCILYHRFLSFQFDDAETCKGFIDVTKDVKINKKFY